jgi:hypothetical protein
MKTLTTILSILMSISLLSASGSFAEEKHVRIYTTQSVFSSDSYIGDHIRASAAGRISPGYAEVPVGGDFKFDIEVSYGHRIDEIKGCNGSLNQTSEGWGLDIRKRSTYKITEVTADCKVSILFEMISFNIDVSSKNGRLKAHNDSFDVREVLYGEHLRFDLIPDDGFKLGTVEGCNGKIDRDYYAYSTPPITEICEIKATFVPDTVAQRCSESSSPSNCCRKAGEDEFAQCKKMGAQYMDEPGLSLECKPQFKAAYSYCLKELQRIKVEAAINTGHAR